ncbi:MAG: hypothetical protein P9X24_14280 [Candidatus Hatepunaea meridiana]|nr:hypothetical protein [Candidatus Hatepunaea meridiana]
MNMLRCAITYKKRYDVFYYYYLVPDRKPSFYWILTPFCHSREGGNPGETISYLDSRLRGNDKKGLISRKTEVFGQTLSSA